MRNIPNNRLSVAWINGMALSCPEKLVEGSEKAYYRQIADAAAAIAERKESCSVLLLSGPSASTKTTTAAKLAGRLLTEYDIRCVVLSLDNFFKNRCDLTRLPDGSIDFESIDTVDLEKLHLCIEELMQTGRSEFPIFDFSTGRRSERTQPVTIDSNTLLLMEGIHALNPAVAKGHDPAGFFKLYISPNSDYYLDDVPILTARQVRLIRRLVRDYYHRGNPVGRTFDMWKGVVSSEQINILPFREDADFIIDSTMRYEPNIYEFYLEQILDEQPVEERYEPELAPLREALAHFIPLEREQIPETTVLQEFLPG